MYIAENINSGLILGNNFGKQFRVGCYWSVDKEHQVTFKARPRPKEGYWLHMRGYTDEEMKKVMEHVGNKSGIKHPGIMSPIKTLNECHKPGQKIEPQITRVSGEELESTPIEEQLKKIINPRKERTWEEFLNEQCRKFGYLREGQLFSPEKERNDI